MTRPRQLWLFAVPALLLAGGAVAFWFTEDTVPAAPHLADRTESVDGSEERASPDKLVPGRHPVAAAKTGQAVADMPASSPEGEGVGQQNALSDRPHRQAEGIQDGGSHTGEERARSQEGARRIGKAELQRLAKHIEQEVENRVAERMRAIALTFKVTLGGTVLDADGKPVAQSSINVRTKLEGETESDSRIRSWMSDGFGAGRANAEGKFRFEFSVRVPEGTQQVEFFVSARRDVSTPPRTDDSVVFRLSNGGVRDDLRLQLRPQGQLKGRVLRAAGEPAKNAEVCLTACGSNGGGRLAISTGSDGEYLFEYVDAGDYIITASRGGLQTQAEGVRTSVQANQVTTLADLVVEHSAVMIVELSAGGVSAANKEVQLVWFAADGTRLSQTSARSGENGEVHFSQVPTGTLHFMITCPGCNPTERLTTRLAPGETYKYGAIALSAAKGK